MRLVPIPPKPFLAAVVLAMIVPILAEAKTLTRKHERLAGVSRFELDIVPPSEEAKSLGVSGGDLRYVIEANLKKAKLPLEANSRRVVPYLLAEVKIACPQETPACGFVLVLRFDDVVLLRGNTTYAQTWEWNFVGVAQRGEVAVAVLGALRDRGMPNFVRDFLRANP